MASQFLLATCPTCVAERPVLASCTLAQTHRRRMHRGHVTRTLRAGCLRAWCMRDWRHLSSVRDRFECDMEPKFKRPVASSRALAAFTKGTQLEIQYAGAPSGVDANLLVLLHGLGDTSKPFFRLGEQLQRTLPQTAILSVCRLQFAYLYWMKMRGCGGIVLTHSEKSICAPTLATLFAICETCLRT